jgi:predicted ABC-type sugar transport system permease subunit
MGPRFMRPCKSWSLNYLSLFDRSLLVETKSGLCVPVLIGPHKLRPNKQTIGHYTMLHNSAFLKGTSKLQNSILQHGVLQNGNGMLQNGTLPK